MLANSGGVAYAILSLGVMVGGALGISGVKDLSNPPAAGLVLDTLSYVDGEFHQLVKVRGRQTIRGAWAAKITRDGRILCSGGGVSAYDGTAVRMEPSTWTGDTCPDILPGDVATATWEWQEGNLTQAIGGTLTIQ